VKVAFADRAAYIADPEHARVPVEALLDKGYARRRAGADRRACARRRRSGTRERHDLSVRRRRTRQSRLVDPEPLHRLRSGIGCGDTGIVLQSRGAGFVLEPDHPNCIAPNKRPFHTIIPACCGATGDRNWRSG